MMKRTRVYSVSKVTAGRWLAGAIALVLSAAASAQTGESPDADGLRRLRAVPEIERWLDRDAATSAKRTPAAISVVRCNCTDRPEPHYPYVMVVVSSEAETLVARLEAHENAFRATPIAVRRGLVYCSADEPDACYGEFAHPCQFTDARYGRVLSEFFPECKLE